MELFASWESEVRLLALACTACVLGAVVGLERELRGKSLGLRTHAAVATAAALFVGLGNELMEGFAEGGDANLVRSDPTRVIEAIVTGVSFLGAGTIIVRRRAREVEGLTTAASLLLSASIGVAVGVHYFITAVGVAVLSWLLLAGLGALEHRFLHDRGRESERTHRDAETKAVTSKDRAG